MSEVYAPPTRPMREVFQEVSPEDMGQMGFAGLALLEAQSRFGNMGLVSRRGDSFDFVSVSDRIASLMGGKIPKPEAFTFTSSDMFLIGNQDVPFSQEKLVEMVKKEEAIVIRLYRRDTFGKPSVIEVSLSPVNGTELFIAQLVDTTKTYFQKKELARKDYVREVRISLETVMLDVLAEPNPTEEEFLRRSLASIKEKMKEAGQLDISFGLSHLEDATVIMERMADTNEITKDIELPQNVLHSARNISSNDFLSAGAILSHNEAGYTYVTAVAAFPDRHPDPRAEQKIMSIFSHGAIPEIYSDSLPYIMQDLRRLLVRFSEKIHDIYKINTALKESRTDSLTGIPNRRAFEERAFSEIAAIERRLAENPDLAIHYAMFLGDIDHFKLFNDTYGHPTGDKVLHTVGQTMFGTKRTEDFVSRFGGEEFLVFVEGDDDKAGFLAAERQRKTIESTVFTIDESERRNITMSFGVVPLEDVVRMYTRSELEHAFNNPKMIEITDPEVADIVFDPANPRKSIHQLKTRLIFNTAHSLASTVNHFSKHAGRNTVSRAVREPDGSWKIINKEGSHPVNLNSLEYKPIKIAGRREDIMTAISTHSATAASH